jgi:hypothetical protein
VGRPAYERNLTTILSNRHLQRTRAHALGAPEILAGIAHSRTSAVTVRLRCPGILTMGLVTLQRKRRLTTTCRCLQSSAAVLAIEYPSGRGRLARVW